MTFCIKFSEQSWAHQRWPPIGLRSTLLFGPLARDESAAKMDRLHGSTSGGHRLKPSRPVAGSCAAIFWITCRCLASAAARGCGQVEPSARPTSAACTPPSLHPYLRRLLPLMSPVRPRHFLTGGPLGTRSPLPARPLSNVWQRSGEAAADSARFNRRAASKARRVASAAHERMKRSIEGRGGGVSDVVLLSAMERLEGSALLIRNRSF